MKNRFIIYSPEFNENIGGSIALHRLCHFLNLEGETALIWPFDKPEWIYPQPIKSICALWHSLKYGRLEYKISRNLITPIANYSDLKDAIIIYPEIIGGNPLFAKKIVRWFLHKPGFHTGTVDYLENELYFFYQQAFNDKNLNKDGDNLLQIIFLRNDIYYQSNFGERKGTCYILRKGRGKKIVHDLTNSILIDDLPHKEIADIFNSVEMCISYDLHTMYSEYAALCGCTSIVIPEEGLSKDRWRSEESKRYGIAYGFDDIDYAKNTRQHLLPTLIEQENISRRMVKDFIIKCKKHFK
ncbi:hypothetical protein RO575_17535 [Methylomonas sp. MO1]|uniref:hypothetical protein n=1 Tax=unclassified Methylomonas TaxID=2608980 RepID=UPI00047CD179|nr:MULTISPECIES: hypothetical protein [unclassified Methylomonas]MDT4291371.1 hypothetical protein [Methylomonas sp. MO1]